jgi:protein phosphatase
MTIADRLKTMENDAATLYCPNEFCQSPNPLDHNFCQRCSTPLPKRFLWAVGDGLDLGKSGDILADRYLVIEKNVVLDTRPGLVPHTPEIERLQEIKPYLRLFPYRLNVPQVYGVLPTSDGEGQNDILLLEKPPITVGDVFPYKVELLSDLRTAWSDATSMRQLNWLWQIAHLWQPLASEGVALSLLDPNLLRVEGSLVRLLELRSDGEMKPQLSDLGAFWQEILTKSKPAVSDFLSNICRSLIDGKIHSAEQLIIALDQGLVYLGSKQSPNIVVATTTDTGPSRARNEDACYPASDSLINKPPQQSALAIVCDGIGGHEGGNVASNLAIQTIQQQLQQLTTVKRENIDPAYLLADLERVTAAANDKISQVNDNENRQGRQRMGTTVVMALPIAHEMYITHVGDSRAYWITRHGCYQVTLDDDVASREVRLGYAVYREALLAGASGSLVQALGMGQSMSLHPTSTRFVLDEDSVFLLCSDGLSDYDRVEQNWETEILPILDGKTDAKSVIAKLVEIANEQNGHDNVTIALTHYQLKYFEPETPIKEELPDFSSLPQAEDNVFTEMMEAQSVNGNSPNAKTKVLAESASIKNNNFKLPLQLIIPSILAVIAGSVGLWAMNMRTSPDGLSSPQPGSVGTSGSNASENTSGNTPGASTPELGEPKQWSLLTTNRDVIFQKPNSATQEFTAPKGSVLQVTKVKLIGNIINQDYDLTLQICPTALKPEPTLGKRGNSSKDIQLLPPKEEVPILFSKIKPGIASIQPGDPKKCSTTPSDSSTPPIETSPSPEKSPGEKPEPSLRPQSKQISFHEGKRKNLVGISSKTRSIAKKLE